MAVFDLHVRFTEIELLGLTIRQPYPTLPYPTLQLGTQVRRAPGARAR